MTDYISREAAMSLPFANDQYDHVHADPHFIAGCETYKEWLETIPAADVVEVVRCRDCIHRDPEDHKCDCGGQERQGCPLPVRGNYFCAHGKRKDGGQNDGTA